MAGSARGRYCAKICLRQGCVSRAQPFRLRRAGQRLPPAEVLRASSQPPSVPLANRCGDDVIPRGCGRLARGPAVRDAEGSCCERCCHLMEGEQLLQRASQPAAGWPREGHPGGARVILRLTQAGPDRLSEARRVTSCGACALYLGMHPGCVRVLWCGHEGRHGHVGCGKAAQGPPALAHRHRLGLRGERARPARAAGIAGGCHGPRVDRTSPGLPHRRRKPSASHPELARQVHPDRPLPRPPDQSPPHLLADAGRQADHAGRSRRS